MRNGKTALILTSSGDVTAAINAYGPKINNYKLFSTNLDASNKLEDLNLSFSKFKLNLTPEALNKNDILSDKIVSAFDNEQKIKGVFNYQGDNLTKYISYDLHLFIGQMVFASQLISANKQLSRCSNFIIFNKLKDTIAKDVTNEDFISFAIPFLKRNCNQFNFNKLITRPHTLNIKALSLWKFSTIDRFFYNTYTRNKYPVLFLIPGSHAVKMVKIFKEMDKINVKYLVIVHNLVARDRIRLMSNRILFINRDAFDFKGDTGDVSTVIRAIKYKWQKERNKISIKVSDRAGNAFYNNVMRYRLDYFTKFTIQKIISDLYTAKEIYKKYQPKIIVTTTDPNVKVLPYINTAKSMKIKSLTLQHGAYAWKLGVNFVSDKALLWGKYYQEWFKKYLNKNTPQLITTGSSFFDTLRISTPERVKKGRSTMLILLSYPSSLLFHISQEFEQLAKALESADVANVYLRSHPWQAVSPLISAMSKFTKIKIAPANDHSLNYYFNKSSIVVTMNTTAGFEALIRGKSLVYWDIDRTNNLPFAEAGVPVASTANEVIQFVKDYKVGKLKLDNKKRKSLLEKVFFRLDSLSSKRIAHKIAGELRN